MKRIGIMLLAAALALTNVAALADGAYYGNSDTDARVQFVKDVTGSGADPSQGFIAQAQAHTGVPSIGSVIRSTLGAQTMARIDSPNWQFCAHKDNPCTYYYETSLYTYGFTDQEWTDFWLSIHPGPTRPVVPGEPGDVKGQVYEVVQLADLFGSHYEWSRDHETNGYPRLSPGDMLYDTMDGKVYIYVGATGVETNTIAWGAFAAANRIFFIELPNGEVTIKDPATDKINIGDFFMKDDGYVYQQLPNGMERVYTSVLLIDMYNINATP